MPTAPTDPPADDDTRPDNPALRPPDGAPRTLGTFGMWLFLAALFMLFAASMVGYVIIRHQATAPPEVPIKGATTRPVVPLQTLHFPATLWVSTVLVIGVSVAMSVAHAYFRRGLQQPYRKALIAALALGAGFVTVQTPAMIQLIMANKAAMAQRHHFYMLVFFLVLLHALHVLGGMIALGRLALRHQHGGYDPANRDPVAVVGMYWHFLDLIWLGMFTTFMVMK
jgi:heme/copper-type cytochrome/quinol oxidase subunit 3